MEASLAYISIMAALFAAAFVSKRRFGLLGLALAAGSLLSGIWAVNAELAASILGAPSGMLTATAISSAIVLLPAVLLLFHGYTYKNLIGRIIGAFLFTLLAITFLIEPLGHVLIPQGLGANFYEFIVANQDIIVGIGLILAVIDLFLTKPAHLGEKKRAH